MPKISNKTLKQLNCLIGDVISFNNVEEFEDAYSTHELFRDPPDQWNEEEQRLCDYQVRISSELYEGIRKIFGRGE